MSAFASAAEIKVGVIGYGGAFNMGRAHLQQMQLAGMTPLAVVELNEERLAVAREEFPGIQTYTTVEAMLAESDVNLVTLITPHDTHTSLALQCLRAGKHVCVEKPMAVTTDDCREMAAEAEARGLVVTTYHNRHWDGCILKARRQILDERLIGDVVRIEACNGRHGLPGSWWRSSKSVSGGVLYDWGVHLTEYALQLIDDEMVEVFGVAHRGRWNSECSWGEDTNEDEATAVVRFKGGAMFTLRVSQLEAEPPEFAVKVTGTHGCYSFSPHGGYRVVSFQNGERFEANGKEQESEGWRYYQNVADHLVDDAALIITAAWSTRPIHVLDLACRSAAEGRTLPVEIP